MKTILEQVINEFLELDGEDYSVVKIDEIKGCGIIRSISSYFVGTLKKVGYVPEKYHKTMGFFIRKMMNTAISIVSLDIEFCNKLFKNFGIRFLEFKEFIKKYNLSEKYFKEYYYATFSGLFILIFGKIKNFRLFDIIIKLWIIVDNIFDCVEDFGEMGLIWKKNVYDFFVGGAFLNREKRMDFFMKSGGGPIIECFKNIEELKMSEKLKDGLYMRFYKLFMFSYSIEDDNDNDKSEFEILKKSCLKTKKALDIFFYTIDYKKKKEDTYKILHLSLIIQLLDDLMDIRKDIQEGNKTIFTGEGEGKTKNAVRLFQLIKNSRIIRDYGFQIFYEGLVFFFMDYNAEFFDGEIVEKIRRECPIMDFKYYNLREIDGVVESEIMEKIIAIYLSSF